MYRAVLDVVGTEDAVEVRCSGPDAEALAIGIEATLRAAGPRSSGRMAASVRRRRPEIVVVGGPSAPHAPFQRARIAELAHAVLMGPAETEPGDASVPTPARASSPGRCESVAKPEEPKPTVEARLVRIEATIAHLSDVLRRLSPADFEEGEKPPMG